MGGRKGKHSILFGAVEETDTFSYFLINEINLN